MRKGKSAIAVVIQTMYDMGREEKVPSADDFFNVLLNISDGTFDDQLQRFLKLHPEWK